MKNLLKSLLVFSTLFITNFLNAQTHLDSTSTWTYHRNFWDGPNGTYHDYRTITLEGDTTIQGNTYFKQYTVGVDTQFLAAGGHVITVHPKTLSNLVRDDANHFYSYINGIDSMVFDFSKVIGDSVKTDQTSCVATITNIDSVYLGTTILKRFHLSSEAFPIYIEGIGPGIEASSFMPSCMWAGQPALQLTCYEKQGVTLILDNSIPCGVVYNSVSNIEPKQLNFIISPNPSSSTITIQLEDDVTEGQVLLFSLEGKLLQTKSLNINTLSLDIKAYPKGVYLLKVKTPNGINTQKIIKN